MHQRNVSQRKHRVCHSFTCTCIGEDFFHSLDPHRLVDGYPGCELFLSTIYWFSVTKLTHDRLLCRISIFQIMRLSVSSTSFAAAVASQSLFLLDSNSAVVSAVDIAFEKQDGHLEDSKTSPLDKECDFVSSFKLCSSDSDAGILGCTNPEYVCVEDGRSSLGGRCVPMSSTIAGCNIPNPLVLPNVQVLMPVVGEQTSTSWLLVRAAAKRLALESQVSRQGISVLLILRAYT